MPELRRHDGVPSGGGAQVWTSRRKLSDIGGGVERAAGSEGDWETPEARGGSNQTDLPGYGQQGGDDYKDIGTLPSHERAEWEWIFARTADANTPPEHPETSYGMIVPVREHSCESMHMPGWPGCLTLTNVEGGGDTNTCNTMTLAGCAYIRRVFPGPNPIMDGKLGCTGPLPVGRWDVSSVGHDGHNWNLSWKPTTPVTSPVTPPVTPPNPAGDATESTEEIPPPSTRAQPNSWEYVQ